MAVLSLFLFESVCPLAAVPVAQRWGQGAGLSLFLPYRLGRVKPRPRTSLTWLTTIKALGSMEVTSSVSLESSRRSTTVSTVEPSFLS